MSDKRPTRKRKPTEKVKEALARRKKTTKVAKRNMVFLDVEEDAPPRKKKNKHKAPIESDADTDKDTEVNEEPPKISKTRVFSRASEDSRRARANTEVSNNLDDSGNASTGETDGKQSASDEDEWEYEQLDEMATKDAEVSKIVLSARSFQLTLQRV